MTNLPEALQAMDRLNSWVRSPSSRRGISSMAIMRRVYQAKGGAIKTADVILQCTHRPLTSLAICRTCGGTGVFTRWHNRQEIGERCRNCRNSGVVRLDFVETHIYLSADEIIRWHSPFHNFPLPATALGIETTAYDWMPNLPGRDMTANDVARDLLVIDAQWPPRGFWAGMDDEFYTLYIGEAVDACAHCGSNIALGRIGRRVDDAEFTVAACTDCRNLPSEQLFRVPIPQELWEPVHVQEWIKTRNQAREAKERNKAYA